MTIGRHAGEVAQGTLNSLSSKYCKGRAGKLENILFNQQNEACIDRIKHPKE